ncbi:MAG: tetratricopeptide repeat protein [Nitrospirae bacterium]|nr:MAG: tetratricopeptide repeat protein [Nitrospirota bacterium]
MRTPMDCIPKKKGQGMKQMLLMSCHHVWIRWRCRQWEHALFSWGALPLLIVSCAALPDGIPVHHHNETVQEETRETAQAYFHFLRGSLAELAHDYGSALTEYQIGLRYDPDSVYLRLRLASLYFSRGEMQATVEVLDQISPDQVEEAKRLRAIAKMYAGAGRAERAVEFFDHAIHRDPQDAHNYYAKGIFLLNRDRLDEAQQVFEQGLARDSISHVGWFYLGKVFERQGNWDRAVEAYRKALVRAPQQAPIYQALGALFEKQGQVAQAIQVLDQYLHTARMPRRQVRQELIRLLIQEKAYDRALQELTHLIENNPHDLSAKVRRALVYGQMGRYDQAIAELHAIVQAHPAELRIRDYLGLMYEEIQDYDRAIQTYTDNIALSPNFYDSRVHLGFLLYRLKRYEEAIPHLQQAVALNPGNPDSFLLLGLTYLQAKQPARAKNTFEEGIKLHPQNVDLRFNLGVAYDKLNRFDDVVREMEAVLALNPDYADALNYLGYSYADRGIHIEKAVTLTKRAVALKPHNGYYIDSLGWALFKMGKLDEALQKLKQAADLVKDDPVIFEHLGEVYLQQNQREKAREAWERSLKVDPSNERLRQRYREQGFETPSAVGDDGDREAAAPPTVSQFSADPGGRATNRNP